MIKGVNRLINRNSYVAEQSTGKLVLMFAVAVTIIESNLFSQQTSVALLSVNSKVFLGLQIASALPVLAVR